MTTVTVNVPETTMAALRRSPAEFGQEMKLAAALHWYQQGTISQERAAEFVGMNRRDFIRVLARDGVEVLNLTDARLIQELELVESQA